MSFFSRIIYVLCFAFCGSAFAGSSLPLPSVQNTEAIARLLSGPQFDQLKQQMLRSMFPVLFAARVCVQHAPASAQPAQDIASGTGTLKSLFGTIGSLISGGFALAKGASWIASFFGKTDNLVATGALAGAVALLALQQRRHGQALARIEENQAGHGESLRRLEDGQTAQGQTLQGVQTAVERVRIGVETNTQTLNTHSGQLQELQTSATTTISVLGAHTTALSRLQEGQNAQGQTLNQHKTHLDNLLERAAELQQQIAAERAEAARRAEEAAAQRAEMLARFGTLDESLSGVRKRVDDGLEGLDARFTDLSNQVEESSTRVSQQLTNQSGQLSELVAFTRSMSSSSSSRSHGDGDRHDDTQPMSPLELLMTSNKQKASHGYGSPYAGSLPFRGVSPLGRSLYTGLMQDSSTFPKSLSDSTLRIGYSGYN